MYGYFYLDQLACVKFSLFHMLLEICKSIKIISCLVFFLRVRSRSVNQKTSRNAVVWLPTGSTFSFGWVSRIVLNCRLDWHHFHVSDIYSVRFANNFVYPQSAAEYRLWIQRLWWRRPFFVLSSSEHQEEQRIFVSREMGGVHGSQWIQVCCHWLWASS